MKRFIVLFLLLFTLFTTLTLAEEINNVLTSADLWGITKEQMIALGTEDYKECTVGKANGLLIRDVSIDNYDFDVYYVFSDSLGDTYGLSKIAYILSDSAFVDNVELKECFDKITNSMKETAGTPESTDTAVVKWDMGSYTIQIGTGRFKNYIGNEDLTLGIILKHTESSKSVAAPESDKHDDANIDPAQTSDDERSQFSGPMVTVDVGGKKVQIHQSFKDLMDSYEDYFNKYVDVMSSGDTLKMVELLPKYAEMITELDELEDTELTNNETAYYIEVHSRILQKIALYN